MRDSHRRRESLKYILGCSLWNDRDGFLLHSQNFLLKIKRRQPQTFFMSSVIVRWGRAHPPYILALLQQTKPNKAKMYFLKLFYHQNKNQLIKGCGTHRKVDSLQRHKKKSSVFYWHWPEPQITASSEVHLPWVHILAVIIHTQWKLAWTRVQHERIEHILKVH